VLSKTLYFDSDDALGVVGNKLGTEHALTKIGRRFQLGWLIALVLNCLVGLRDAWRLRVKRHDLTIEEAEHFGEETDQLWERAAAYFPAIVPRNAQYLNWKFVDQPHMQYKRFIVKRVDAVCGYVIIRKCRRPEPELGIIADVFALPDDDTGLQALLVYATQQLRREGVKTIIAASSLSSYVAHFLRMGFNATRQMTAVFRCKGETWLGMANHSKDWFLSMGDHDWDQYPLRG
jgi:hypothetical protein